MINITIIPTREDNYSYLLDSTHGETAVIDAAHPATPIINALHKKKLTHILITHHHYDHIDGVPALKSYAPEAQIYAAKADSHRIPNINKALSEGDIIPFGDEELHIIDTPGHTCGHIAYYAPQSKALFCADTLFSLGCGRLFEGTAEQMWQSLEKFKSLPDDTYIYPGHEYTLANSAFCLAQNPDNTELKTRIKQAEQQRAQNQPTIPTTLAQEKATNPFLQAKTAKEFAQLRSLKDKF